MQSPQKYQRQLLHQIRFANRNHPISEATEDAYLRTPRHAFVSKYRAVRSKDWNEVTAENLSTHLTELYADKPLILAGDDDAGISSTISQPSLVLRMLDMLRLEPGLNVFELGAGSGWNAALMSRLVEPAGQVYTLEIIPEIASRAETAIQSLGISNVSVIEADAGEGYAPGAPYDRAIFTAGTYDIPRYFYQQIKNDGLLLAVIKIEGGGDCLFLLQKISDHFESLESSVCAFIPISGKYRNDGLGPICLEKTTEWTELGEKEISKIPFWWGGKGQESFAWRTLGVRSFLAITEPLFRVFKADKVSSDLPDQQYFGLWDNEGKSLVIAKDDSLISYGSPVARDRLMDDLERWLALGMPTTASFRLSIYSNAVRLRPAKNQWIVKRSESQFLWTLAL